MGSGTGAAGTVSKRSGSAERTYGKEHKGKRNGKGNGNEPVGHIARPSAKRVIQPNERQDAEHGTDHLVKELLQDSPEALESPRLRGRR